MMPTAVGFDKLAIDHELLLGLPFREGTGLITHDRAKPHHLLTQVDTGGGSFTWGNLVTGCSYLQWAAVGGGVGDGVYLNCPAVDTADLDFTTGSFSLGGWINWDSTGDWSEMIYSRGGVDIDGWDIYLAISLGRNTLSQRHHHFPDRSECFSTGWTPGEWHFFGVSRIGGNLYPVHYRNGMPLEMDYGGATMLDPATCNRALIMGCRYDFTLNWYRGMMWNMRIWDRALEDEEWKFIFDRERHWFN